MKSSLFGDEEEIELEELKSLFKKAGVELSAAKLERKSAHLLTLAVGEDSSGIEQLKRIHVVEEGSAEDITAISSSKGIGIDYVHVGWSYTTAIGSNARALASMVPIVVRSQSIWLNQKAILNGVVTEDHDQRSRDARLNTLALAEVQKLRFEITLWSAEIEGYLSTLIPWQKHLMEVYFQSWGIDNAHKTLMSMLDRTFDLYRTSYDQFVRKTETHQANTLFIIAVVQLIGIAGAIKGFFDLVDTSKLDTHFITDSAAFYGFVVALPFIVTATILVLTFTALRRQ